MRTYDEYHKILELWERGIPKKRIGIMLNIPRLTVHDCIKRYGSLQGLEENREQASKSTPDKALGRIKKPQNTDVQKAYAYVLGIYLGDGNIVKSRRVYRLRITLDARYPNIIHFCSEQVKMLLPENEIGIVGHYFQERLSCVDVSSYHKFWPELLPQHGEGRKHEREIKLYDWQQQIVDSYPLEFFRGLYHSDGSRFSNIVNGKDYPRYQFSNTSADIRDLFCHACDLLGLKWTTNSKEKIPCKDVYISKRPDVAFLDQHIGPKT